MDTDAKNRTIRLGDVTFEIIDPNFVEPAFADLITDGREANGIISLGFGFIMADGDGGRAPVIQVTSRMRITLTGALDLRNMLDRLLKGTVPAKEQTN